MLRKNYDTQQLTLLDHSFLMEELIPQDSWAREFRSLLTTIAPREFCEELYHPNLGRPAANPTVLTGALLVQARRGWSDRELEHHVRFDMETKYALGLDPYHKGFDHSTFEYHRNQRMLKGQKDRGIFDAVINRLIVDGILPKDALQIIDSTYHNANIALVGPREFLRRGIVNVIRVLRAQGVVTNEEVKSIGLGGYLAHLDRKAKASKLGDGRMDDEKKRKELKAVYEHAKKLLELVDGRSMDVKSEVEVQLLKRYIEETVEAKGEDIQERKRTSVQDRIVSVVDTEARYGVKNKSTTFNGYKSTITGTTDGIITGVLVTPGNVHDGKVLAPAVEELIDRGFDPKICAGDTSYGYGENRAYAKSKSIELYAKAPEKSKQEEGFVYDEQTDTFTCPHGLASAKGRLHKDEVKVDYTFPVKQCKQCPMFATCVGEKKQKRLRLSRYHHINAQGRALNETPEYKETMRQRSIIERAFASLINRCNLRVFRLRGIRKALYQVFMASAMLNVMTYFRLKKAQACTA
ncbi:MAG: IS1182 family transposase [Bacillota bacterium]